MDIMYTSVTISLASDWNIFILNSDAYIVDCARSRSSTIRLNSSKNSFHSFLFHNFGGVGSDAKVIMSKSNIAIGDLDLVLPGTFSLKFTIAYRGPLLEFTLAKAWGGKSKRSGTIELTLSGEHSCSKTSFRHTFQKPTGNELPEFETYRFCHTVRSNSDTNNHAGTRYA